MERREGRRDWKLSIFNLDMAPLGHFSRFQDVIEFLSIRTMPLAVDQLSHHQNVRVSIGEGGRRKEMFIVTRIMNGVQSMGLTELGIQVFNSNEVKYPNGIAIEERNGNFLAGCRSGTKAAELLRVSRQRPNNAIRESRNGTGTGDVGGFKVRYLTNADTFGVTKRGKKVLPGWTDDWVD
mmetsp:Transcript_27343/g.39159  ORF Transcript_27343/g.39159 Transcript_27343/m.39159 type:complete len:180 (+) Transcript_27343:141-680(+)